MPERTEHTENPEGTSPSERDAQAAAGTSAPVKPRMRSTAWSMIFVVMGLTCGVFAVLWKFGQANDATMQLTRLGVTLYHMASVGIGMLSVGLLMYVAARKNQRIAGLMDELETACAAPQQQPAETPVVVDRVEPMMQNLTAMVTDLREQMEQFSAALGTVEEKVSHTEHTSLTLAASVDGLGAKMEKMQDKLQKDVKAPAQKMPSVSDELAPLARLLDSIGRDEHSRASRQLEAIEGVLDNMAAMEKRLRDQIESVKIQDTSDKVVSQVATTVSQLPKQISEPLTAKVDQALDSVMKRLESALATQRAELTAIAADSRKATPAVAPAPMMTPVAAAAAPAALPAPPSDAVENSQFGEGPKETKTVLRAIDKLRSLRGA